MYSHHNDNDTTIDEVKKSAKQEFIEAIPFIRAVYSDSKSTSINVITYDAFTVSTQVASTYLLKINLFSSSENAAPNDMPPHHMRRDASMGSMDESMESMSDMTAMQSMSATQYAKEGVNMCVAMYIGEAVGKYSYALAYPVIKKSAEKLNQRFSKDGFLLTAGKMLPVIGPFITANDQPTATWGNVMWRGVKSNIEQIGMLGVGTLGMMASPTGMEKDSVSVAITSSIMIGAMATFMVAAKVPHIIATTPSVRKIGQKISQKVSNCFSTMWYRDGKEKQQLLPQQVVVPSR